MTERKSATASGLFVWYGEGSYFRPHWQDLLNARGFADINLDPSFKSRNSDALKQATKEWNDHDSPIILLTVGEIPLSLSGLRSLPPGTSVVFMTDDEWRFHSVGRYLARYFDLVVTNTPLRVKDYETHGLTNVIHAPYAANTSVFHPIDCAKQHDLVMIGAAHPDRVELVRRLVSSNLPIEIFGAGWERYPDLKKQWGGFLSTEQMVSVIASSKIVINPGLTIGGLPQVKGRIFETAACRTFQITQQIPGLDAYFELEKELETYEDFDELVEKIEKYLANDNQRESIAEAAFQRAITDHSWESRIDTILAAAISPIPVTRNDPSNVTILDAEGDQRSKIETAVQADDNAMIAFSSGDGADDPDRIALLSHGLTSDMRDGVSMNLASFDIVDRQRRVIANANIKVIAKREPALLPPRSIMLQAKKCLEIIDTGEITQRDVMSKVVPEIIQSGEYRHIDLDTGLFEEPATGEFSITNVYRQSVDGLWDVRTRPYAREVLRRLAVFDVAKLGVGILRRRNARRTPTSN